MSAADKEALRASGLGDMDADEFNAMMEDDGEEVGFNLDPLDALVPSLPPPPPPPLPLRSTPDLDLSEQGHGKDVNRFEDDIESEMGPTQSDESGKVCPPTYPFRVCIKMFHSDRPCVRGAWQAFRPLFDD
jgi:cell cycle checkpoint control protein RAD9A